LLISIICFSNQAKLNVKSKTKVTQLDFILEEILPYKNVIIKYGRYIPNQTPHYDEVLGVNLASDNQYAERL
jgi:hypothetical protein